MRLVVVGEVLSELMRPERDRPLGERGHFLGPYPSGAPAIVASVAARLGATVDLVGCVGVDPFGAAIVTRLEDDGVGLGSLQVDPTMPTACAFVAYDPQGGRQFLFHIAGAAADRIDPEVARATAEGADWIHVSGSSLTLGPGLRTAVLTAAETVHRSGGRISLDPNIRRSDDRTALAELRRLALLAHVVLPSAGELEVLGLTREQLVDAGTLVCETLGPRGAILHQPGRAALPVAAPVREEVDPTGAGDHLAGAFLSAMLAGAGPEHATELACHIAADSVTVQGPMEAPVRSPAGWPVA
jgi:sugar/nucleoside kinase (ribokinase family)